MPRHPLKHERPWSTKDYGHSCAHSSPSFAAAASIGNILRFPSVYSITECTTLSHRLWHCFINLCHISWKAAGNHTRATRLSSTSEGGQSVTTEQLRCIRLAAGGATHLISTLFDTGLLLSSYQSVKRPAGETLAALQYMLGTAESNGYWFITLDPLDQLALGRKGLEQCIRRNNNQHKIDRR